MTKSKREKKETYTIKCRCTNCGISFDLEIEKGLFFVERAGNSKYVGTPITALSRDQDGYMWEKTVNCPNCGTGDITR